MAYVPPTTSILLLLLLLCSTAAMMTASAKKEKRTHLHFYLHDNISEPNSTAVRVARGSSNNSVIGFGDVFIIDDPLTKGPSLSSGLVGRSQGFYMDISQGAIVLMLSENIVFVEGEYNGSTLSVQGRRPLVPEAVELPVIGGTGRFRLARGYALLTTYFLNSTSGDAIVEYNVTVLHP